MFSENFSLQLLCDIFCIQQDCMVYFMVSNLSTFEKTFTNWPWWYSSYVFSTIVLVLFAGTNPMFFHFFFPTYLFGDEHQFSFSALGLAVWWCITGFPVLKSPFLKFDPLRYKCEFLCWWLKRWISIFEKHTKVAASTVICVLCMHCRTMLQQHVIQGGWPRFLRLHSWPWRMPFLLRLGLFIQGEQIETGFTFFENKGLYQDCK